jgi:hypothetical protein
LCEKGEREMKIRILLLIAAVLFSVQFGCAFAGEEGEVSSIDPALSAPSFPSFDDNSAYSEPESDYGNGYSDFPGEPAFGFGNSNYEPADEPTPADEPVIDVPAENPPVEPAPVEPSPIGIPLEPVTEPVLSNLGDWSNILIAIKDDEPEKAKETAQEMLYRWDNMGQEQRIEVFDKDPDVYQAVNMARALASSDSTQEALDKFYAWAPAGLEPNDGDLNYEGYRSRVDPSWQNTSNVAE